MNPQESHDLKAQPVRLLDVFLVGPLMMYGGAKLADERRLAGSTLAFLGFLTIVYNGNNWLRVQGEK